MPRLTPGSQTLYAGDPLDAATARRFMDEIDALRADLAPSADRDRDEGSRRAREAARGRSDVQHGGCPQRKDAEARAFLAKPSGSRARSLAAVLREFSRPALRRAVALGEPPQLPWLAALWRADADSCDRDGLEPAALARHFPICERAAALTTSSASFSVNSASAVRSATRNDTQRTY